MFGVLIFAKRKKISSNGKLIKDKETEMIKEAMLKKTYLLILKYIQELL